MSLLQKTVGGIAIALGLAGGAVAAPLHDAAERGDASLIQVLYEAGADVNVRDAEGRTPLMRAAYANNGKTLDRLLMLGADPKARDNDGLLALHWAALAGNAGAAAVLLRVKANQFAGAIASIDDAENEFGATPLILAAGQHDGGLVAWLIAYGADPDIVDAEGYTALTSAALDGDDEIVRILIRGGATCQDIDSAWFAECTSYKTALAP
jgi:ankyrin repeat protein